MAGKGVLKERLLQIVSVTTQWLFRGECPASSYSFEIAKMQEGIKGKGIIDLHQWSGDGVWTRNRNLEGMVIQYGMK